LTAAKKYIPHYTIDDYQQWEGDWELWNGIAVSMSPRPFGSHQRTATELLIALRRELQRADCSAEATYELDWSIGQDTIIRPDVVILCDGIPDRYIETPPALVAEVLSDSTRQRDTTYKRELYDEQGVAVYLLLDPDAKTLETYKRDEANKWQHERVTDSTEFSICGNCKIRLVREPLFR
jgi:Uma2 family endonuclease